MVHVDNIYNYMGIVNINRSDIVLFRALIFKLMLNYILNTFGWKVHSIMYAVPNILILITIQ